MSKKFYCRGRKVEKCKFIFEKSIWTQPGCLPVSDPLGSQTPWPLWLCRNAPDQKPANINLSHPSQMLRLKVQWLDKWKSLSIRCEPILKSFFLFLNIYLSTEEEPFPTPFVEDGSCEIWGSDVSGQQISHHDVLSSYWLTSDHTRGWSSYRSPGYWSHCPTWSHDTSLGPEHGHQHISEEAGDMRPEPHRQIISEIKENFRIRSNWVSYFPMC